MEARQIIKIAFIIALFNCRREIIIYVKSHVSPTLCVCSTAKMAVTTTNYSGVRVQFWTHYGHPNIVAFFTRTKHNWSFFRQQKMFFTPHTRWTRFLACSHHYSNSFHSTYLLTYSILLSSLDFRFLLENRNIHAPKLPKDRIVFFCDEMVFRGFWKTCIKMRNNDTCQTLRWDTGILVTLFFTLYLVTLFSSIIISWIVHPLFRFRLVLHICERCLIYWCEYMISSRHLSND